MKKILLQLLIFPFLWAFRRFCLNLLPGYRISRGARISRLALVFPRRLEMEPGSSINRFTICNSIDLLKLAHRSTISTFTYIGGFPTSRSDFFSHLKERRCELILGEHSAITTRHNLDCTAGIYVGRFTTVAGLRSQLMTHSIDLRENRQSASPIRIGDYCFVGTGCILLGGAQLPSRSILAAGSVLGKAYTEPEHLYGGVPARQLRKLNMDEFKYFTRQIGFVH